MKAVNNDARRAAVRRPHAYDLPEGLDGGRRMPHRRDWLVLHADGIPRCHQEGSHFVLAAALPPASPVRQFHSAEVWRISAPSGTAPPESVLVLYPLFAAALFEPIRLG